MAYSAAVNQTDAPWPTKLSDVIDPVTLQPTNGWVDLMDNNGTHTDVADTTLVPTVEAAVVNALQIECGETSDAHGFQNDWHVADWLEELASYLSKEERFTDDHTNWPGWVNSPGADTRPSTCQGLAAAAAILRTNILGTKIALIHSELSEALESLRKNGGAEGAINGKGNMGEELADAIVRILDTGTFTKDNLGDELLKKMAINRDRPYMHGNKAM